MTDRLAALTAQGVSLWLDDLSRQGLHSGNLKDLIGTWPISGVTTNPSIFRAALKDGVSYQKQLDELAARGARECPASGLRAADFLHPRRPAWSHDDRD